MDRRAGVGVPAAPPGGPGRAATRPPRAPLLLLVLLALLPGAPLSGQDAAERARADTLLARVRLGRVLPGQGAAFANQLRRSAPGLSPSDWARLEPALREELAPDRLREDVVAFLVREAPEGRLASALGGLRSGAAARADSVAGAGPSTETLEEYMAGLAASPPPPERLEAVAELASARAEADFWVVLSEAVRRAAHGVAASVDTVAPYEPMDETGYLVLREEALENVVISNLYRYRHAPDDLLRRAAGAWSAPPVAWFAETYALAVAEAILAAGRRVEARLAGSGGAAGPAEDPRGERTPRTPAESGGGVGQRAPA